MTDTVFGIDFTGNDGNRARFMGGGQVGINYQINNFVIGVEADFDGVANNDNNSGGRVIAGDTIRVNSNDTWIATVAGRIGYAWDRVLFYGKGGGGWSLSVSEVATLQLEFRYLAHASGREEFWRPVEKVMKVLAKGRLESGLAPYGLKCVCRFRVFRH